MQKQNFIHFFSLLLLLTTLFVYAGNYTDKATVVSFTEVTREHTIREPYRDCYMKKFYRYENDSYTNELFGGIIGGAIGNQFGKGHGKDAMTLAGTLLGASIANDAERKNQPIKSSERRICETKYRHFTESQFSHYLVKYDYNGRTFSYTSQYKPEIDSSINVRVKVSPK